MSFQRGGKKGSIGVNKRRTKRQPAWDDTVTDLTVHRLSPDEKNRRTQVQTSVCFGTIRKEVVEKSRRKTRTNSLDDSKSAFLREILYDQTQLSDVIAHTDRVMSVVKDLFVDDPRRREAFPNVTLAPQSGNIQERLQGPVYVRPHTDSQLTTLSESVMDPYALNEVTSSSQDSTLGHLSSDEEKENTPVNFPRRVVDMDRFQRFVTSQQRNTSQPDIQMLPERGPSNKILSDSGNIRMRSGGMQTPEPGDVSVDIPGELSVLAINDTTKVKKKSQSRIDQEVANQKVTQNDVNDLTKVIQGLQQDISTYEKQSGRSTSLMSSGDIGNSGVGYTATLLNTIRRLVGYLTQGDLHLKEERNHRLKLQEQLHHQESLIDAITADVMSMKDQLMSLNLNVNQPVNPPNQSLATPHEHDIFREVQEDSHQQNPVPHKTEDVMMSLGIHKHLPGDVNDVESSSDNPEEAISSSLPSKPPTDISRGMTSSEWVRDLEVPALPGKTLRDLSYVGSLSHVQPSSTALLLSPPRQKDRSMLSQPQGMKHPQWNLPDKRLGKPKVIEFMPPQPANNPIYNTSPPLEGTDMAENSSRGTKLTSPPVFQVGREGLPSGRDALTNLISSTDQKNHPQAASAPQNIIYDHGIFPILQTSLAPAPDVSGDQLDITRRLQALSQQHAQARLRLAQLQTSLPGLQGKTAGVPASLVLSPAVSPIPFQVVSQQKHPAVEGTQGQRITVSLPRVEELEISATSTPSPKSNLSELMKRQKTSERHASQFSSKQQIATTIHQGSTPLAASRKKGTEEGFFSLTAHVGI